MQRIYHSIIQYLSFSTAHYNKTKATLIAYVLLIEPKNKL